MGWAVAAQIGASLLLGEQQRKQNNKAIKNATNAELRGYERANASLGGLSKTFDAYVGKTNQLYGESYMSQERALGQQATGQLAEFNKDPSSYLQKDPSYNFNFNEGTRAINNNAALQGQFGSGKTAQALQRYGQGLASQYQNQIHSRLTNLSQMGGSYERERVGRINAANNQNVGFQQNLANAQAGLQVQSGNAQARGYGNQLTSDSAINSSQFQQFGHAFSAINNFSSVPSPASPPQSAGGGTT